jgi:hypothetical protein
VVEGASKLDVLKALALNDTDQEVMEMFPTCLVEPVPGTPRGLADAERKAGVTWGVDAVRATHTTLTGAGVKVSTPNHSNVSQVMPDIFFMHYAAVTQSTSL